MNTSLQHLPAGRRAQINVIRKIIIATANPEKIFLFGAYCNTEIPSNVFSLKYSKFLGGYFFYIVTKRGDVQSVIKLQDIIENKCRKFAETTAMFCDIDYFNERLAEGHLFFYELKHEAILLYDAGNIPFIVGEFPDYAKVKQIAEQDYYRWNKQAQGFNESALHSRTKGQLKIALFSLHQAVESCFTSIFLVFYGFKITTHNIDKLRRYISNYSYDLASVFYRDEPEDDRLFKILLGSYTKSRYDRDFDVTENDVDLIMSKVGLIFYYSERLYESRMKYLCSEIYDDDFFLVPFNKEL